MENFSYFDCQHGERYYPFGKGSKEKMLNAISGNSLDVRQLDFDFHSLPLLDNPSGHTTLTSESSDLEFDVMCEKILKQLFQIQQKATMVISISILHLLFTSLLSFQ